MRAFLNHSSMISPRSIARILADFRWVVLGMAGIAAFALGCIGYTEYLNNPGPGDVAYDSVKLFFMSAPDQTGLPVALDVARFLAPIVAGYAALSGLASLFRDRAQQMRIPLMRGHVVVCGLGYVGRVFLDHLRRAGFRVVVIESNPANPLIELCRSWNIPVIVGDAQLKRTLRAAGVQRAAQLLAVCDQNAVNTEIVAVARGLATGRALGELRCLARISDPELCALLRIQEANHTNESLSSLDFFNTDEISARLCLDEYPIGAEHGHPHILVSRLDVLGTWLVKHAAWGWFADRTDNTAPLWVTVVDDHADERVHSLLDQYPALEPVCKFIYASTSVRHLRGLAAQRATAGAPPITHAYVNAYRDEDTLEAALALRHELDGAVPLVVALSGAHGAAGLITDASANGELRNTTVFPTLERTCTTELVQGGSFERIAVGIHRRWCVLQVEAGKPAPSWSELDESRKESSRAQARDIPVKLHSIGCTIAPLRDWGAPEFAFTDEEFETLAIAEHKRWITERLQSGWRLGPKDTERKLSPYMIPFEDLDEEIADYDRDAVRQIPAALALVDLQVIRPPADAARIGQTTLVNVPGNGAVEGQKDR
jgi:hypothetical protein